MNVSQAAILKRAADAAVNGQRAQPRGAAAAALGSCCLPSPASSSSSASASSSAASSSSSSASNASSSWASSSSSAAAASSRSALGGGSARRGRDQYYSAGLGGVSNPDRGSLANIPIVSPRSLPLILRLLFHSCRGGRRGWGAPCVCVRRGGGRGGRLRRGRGGWKKKSTAEGRVETDTGSKMAQSPPAPSPRRPPTGSRAPLIP